MVCINPNEFTSFFIQACFSVPILYSLSSHAICLQQCLFLISLQTRWQRNQLVCRPSWDTWRPCFKNRDSWSNFPTYNATWRDTCLVSSFSLTHSHCLLSHRIWTLCLEVSEWGPSLVNQFWMIRQGKTPLWPESHASYCGWNKGISELCGR